MSRENETLAFLAQRIRGGDWKIGGRLPSERELAAMTGTSRNTVRTALRQLEAHGVVDVRRGSGCYLRSRSGIETGIRAGEEHGGRASLQALEANLIVFPSVAALCATRISEEGLLAIEDEMIGLSRAVLNEDGPAICRQVTLFLDILARETGNPALECAARSLCVASEPVFELFYSLDEREREDIFADFVKILHALKRREPCEAWKRMEEHILRMCALAARIYGGDHSEFVAARIDGRGIFG